MNLRTSLLIESRPRSWRIKTAAAVSDFETEASSNRVQAVMDD
jgi:hypothetical protein